MPKITRKINVAIFAFTLALTLLNVVFDFFAVRKILRETYDDFLIQIAKTASSYFKIDRLKYLSTEEGAASDEYHASLIELSNLTENADISFLYVIIPDLPECLDKTYVFNTINSKLRGRYNPYPAGYRENNSEKAVVRYRNLMEKGGMEIDYDYFSHFGSRVRISMALKSSRGRVNGIICIEKDLDSVSGVLWNYVHADILFAPVLAVLFLLLFGSFINRKFVSPLILVTKEADGFASHDAHFSDKLKTIHSNDEIETLARAIDKMGIDIQIYIKDLMKITSEKERIGAELSVATGIQAGMLPKNFSPYEDYPEIELHASMKAAKEVGGDFYDFFWTGRNCLWLVMGDVSGKGVPAAMFMVIAKALIRNDAMQDYEPKEVCERVNRQLCKENEQGLFVTCWIACINLSTGQMKFANAAHNPPVLYDGKNFNQLTQKSGLMLGAIESAEYVQYEQTLKKGDRLFIYTDGVTEAQNKSGTLFGEELLLGVLAKSAASSAKETVEIVNEEVERFEDGTEQSDDITTLVFYLNDFCRNTAAPDCQDGQASKNDSEGGQKCGELELDASDENLPKAMEFILGFLPAGTDKEISNKIELAAEEIFVNISHYAYGEKVGKAKIVCSLGGIEGADGATITSGADSDGAAGIDGADSAGAGDTDANMNAGKMNLCVTFMDSGIPFNPLEKEDPDLTQSAEERRIGGFGIYLTKQFMDKTEYRYENGMNVMTMEKIV